MDASLNNYVALHYAGRHMSWLHCMWGVGATVGPYVMGYMLSGGRHWTMGYRFISIFQIGLTLILLLSLPLWKDRKDIEHIGNENPLSFTDIIHIPGVKERLLR